VKVKAPADQGKFSRLFSRQPLTRLVVSDPGIKRGSSPLTVNSPATSWHEQPKAQVLSPLRTRPSPITLEFRATRTVAASTSLSFRQPEDRCRILSASLSVAEQFLWSGSEKERATSP